MPGARNDPYGAFNFLVDIAGVTKGGFMEVTGLDAEVTVVEYREGGDNTLTVRKLRGLAKYPNIILKRGLTQDHSLWDWFKKTLLGTVQRTTVTITLLDDQRQPALRWNVREAWPCKWEGPTLNAKTSEAAIESIEICHEGIELAE
jgi:phage tail-like protein